MTLEEELNAIDGEIVQAVVMIEGILKGLQSQPEKKVTQTEVKVFMAHITTIAMGVHLQVGIIRKHMGLGVQRHFRPETD